MYISKIDLITALEGVRKRKAMIIDYLEAVGDSRIVCRAKDSRVYYSEVKNNKEAGISKNKKRIYELMLKEFYREQLKILIANERALEYCLKHYQDHHTDAILDKLSVRFTDAAVKDILCSSVSDWSKQPYEKNPFYKENYEFVTTNGVLVRSKSEREIANALEAAGLQYQSDVLIECDDEHYYADFLIMRPDRTKAIWEHFGREHDKVYMAKNQQRIKDYISIGYRPWDNLIWTLDSDLKSNKTIRNIIQRFLLCDVNKGFSRK